MNSRHRRLRSNVIIDDGLHEFEANQTLLESTFDLLSDDGLYIVEDCTLETLNRFEDYLSGRQFVFSAYSGFRTDGHKLADNSLLVIERKR